MEFSIKVFWKMGIICFIVIALGNTYSMVYFWPLLNIGAKAAKVAGVCFNFLLVYFFYWMLKSNNQAEEGAKEMMDDEEMIKLLKAGK